jgi:hypothetical protein
LIEHGLVTTDDISGEACTFATFGHNAELVAQLAYTGCALGHGIHDLSVGYTFTQTYVHRLKALDVF